MKRSVAYRNLKHYFRDIRLLLPTYGKPEKKFLSDFIAEVNDYAGTNPTKDCEQIVAHFGEPKEILSFYLADMDSQDLSKRIATAKHVKIGIAIVVILALIASSVVVGLTYKSHIEAKEAYIAREVVTIDEDE